MGGQVRNEKAQTHMGRAADSQNPQSGAAPGPRRPPPHGRSPDPGHRGQPVSGPGRGRISGCCEGEEKSLSGVAVGHTSVRVLTQVPRRLWSRCPRGAVCKQTVRSAHLPATLLNFSLPKSDSSPPFTTQTLKTNKKKIARNSVELVREWIQPWATNKYWWLETE